MKTKFLAACLTLFLAGCLQTRSELRQDGEFKDTSKSQPVVVSPKQQKMAEAAIKEEDSNKEFRELYGRIENVENQMNQVKDNEKTKALEMKVAQLESELALLHTTVSELNAKAKKEAQLVSSDDQAKQQHMKDSGNDLFKDELAEANKYYNEKKWDDAILAFEDYRKNFPKGRKYPEATLKMALSFQNMNMKSEAKTFFKEVVEKYPKTKEAETAKAKLKKI